MKKRETSARKLAILTLLATALLPDLAFAGTGGNPILNGVNWLVSLLNSTLATSAAVLAITVLGYMAFAGRLAADTVLWFITGIVLVFGGARIIALITGSI